MWSMRQLSCVCRLQRVGLESHCVCACCERRSRWEKMREDERRRGITWYSIKIVCSIMSTLAWPSWVVIAAPEGTGGYKEVVKPPTTATWHVIVLGAENCQCRYSRATFISLKSSQFYWTRSIYTIAWIIYKSGEERHHNKQNPSTIWTINRDGRME